MPVLRGYDRFGGRHGESASVANVLRYLGVTAPHTGEPYTEEMLFGLGGGLGFAYWVFDYEHLPNPMLGVGFRRFGWEGFDTAFVEDMCSRAGAAAETRETSSRAKADRELGQALEEGRPPVVTADWGMLPCSPVPMDLEYVPHVVAVVGVDDADVVLDDLGPTPCRVPRREFAAARAAVRSTHHRVRLISRGEPPHNPAEAIQDALADCAASLLEPLRPNAGLPALLKWSRMMSSRVETKAWRKVFDTPARLSAALCWTHRWIELGTGGGAFRPMYADFLEEASAVMGERAVLELAATYRGLGQRWSALGIDALALSGEPEEALGELDAFADRLAQMHADESAAAHAVREAAGERAVVRGA
ncbi:MAG: DUF4872 domain-containing protein [Coriobacteriia bacterium]|nr:DUF4872 domain-containing protein [Coriobacteriia bacterium]